ncbi:uncharacterized protein KY384_000181 [Bacidia gigantensis]|uniref:uncharacterized protein n=1 Tax=Bacidia gigantensis TaxID=2732470 RepID=UPI001D056DB4|nr:uncharacterized protein KY384_000181 [Bacidia gigantensis]KAG8526188.1 hypothetical protein KY384_000181 [Bacidia gigantensis]
MSTVGGGLPIQPPPGSARMTRSIGGFPTPPWGARPPLSRKTVMKNLVRNTRKERSKYQHKKNLPVSGNGKAVLIERERDRKLFVCKIIALGTHAPSDWLHEVRIVRARRRNERIVRTVKTTSHLLPTEPPPQGQIYTEYCDAGDLFDMILGYKSKMIEPPESLVWHIYLQMAQGLAFLHHGYHHEDDFPSVPQVWDPIIHGDIKPDNVFLRRNQRHPQLFPDVVIGEFGTASKNEDNRILGTPYWAAPECKSTAKADVWSMGACVQNLATGRGPMIDQDRAQRVSTSQLVHFGKYTRQVLELDNYSNELNECVREAMQIDEDERRTSLEIVKVITALVMLGVPR